MIWFTGDEHLNHENIIKYANRPFIMPPDEGQHNDVDTMNEYIVQDWNDVVAHDDITYILGDFTLEGQDTARKFFKRLNGTIIVLSNPWHHDKRWIPHGPYYSKHGAVSMAPGLQVLEFAEYGDSGYPYVITLCHYPLAQWDRKHYGGVHLHGHSHNRYFGSGKILDVGVDSAYSLLGSWRPFSLLDVIEIMSKKEIMK